MHKQNTRRGFTRFFPVSLAGKVACKAVRGAHKGFTLIELLVVVLIIGILATVAVPQYRLATDKTRLQKMVSMTNAVSRAQDAFYLAHGTYTNNWHELDITFPGTIPEEYNNKLYSDEGWTLRLSSLPYVSATNNKVPDITIYAFYSQHNWSHKSACYAKASNAYANKLCQSLSNKSTKDTAADYNTFNVYLF